MSIQQGDSGGPAACGNKIVGVTSWVIVKYDEYGDYTCNPEYPSGYMRVSQFTEWIRDNAGEQDFLER